MIVVDVNVLAYYMIQGNRTAEARQLRDRDPQWILPDFWRIEIQSILCQFVQSKGMDAAAADHLMSEALRLFGPQEASISPNEAMAEALRSGISAYDAQYIALAKQFGTVCITENRELQVKCPGVACSLRVYLEGKDKPPRVATRGGNNFSYAVLRRVSSAGNQRCSGTSGIYGDFGNSEWRAIK